MALHRKRDDLTTNKISPPASPAQEQLAPIHPTVLQRQKNI